MLFCLLLFMRTPLRAASPGERAIPSDGPDADVKQFRLHELEARLRMMQPGPERDYFAGVLANRVGNISESIRLLTGALPNLREPVRREQRLHWRRWRTTKASATPMRRKPMMRRGPACRIRYYERFPERLRPGKEAKTRGSGQADCGVGRSICNRSSTLRLGQDRDAKEGANLYDDDRIRISMSAWEPGAGHGSAVREFHIGLLNDGFQSRCTQ